MKLPRKPRVMVALSAGRADEFFPRDLSKRLADLAADVRLFHPEQNTAHQWKNELNGYRPNVLVSGWGTPAPPCWPEPELEYLCHLTGEIRHLVSRQLIERGLIVTNWGSSISRTVAECTLMLMLCALRRVTQFALTLHRDGGWKTTDASASAFGRRVGIYGFGSIAREFVKLVEPFGCQLHSFDPYVNDATFERHGVTPCRSLDELFSTSQVVIVLAAKTQDTHLSVTEELLRKLSPDGVFINTARASIVDTDALIRIAREGRVQIGLDVFDVEPLAMDHPFRGDDERDAAAARGGADR